MKSKSIEAIIILISTLFVIFSCNFERQNMSKNNYKNLCADTLNQSEYIDSISVNIIEIDSSFFGLLDSIINEELRCPYFKECRTGFLLTTSPIVSENGGDEIMISSINKNRYDYLNCNGVFIFKNILFICDSLSPKKYIKKTKEKTVIKYIRPINNKNIFDKDDSYSNWFIKLSNNELLIAGHLPCEK